MDHIRLRSAETRCFPLQGLQLEVPQTGASGEPEPSDSETVEAPLAASDTTAPHQTEPDTKEVEQR